MRLRRPSVRARLTLWHAGVLTLIVLHFFRRHSAFCQGSPLRRLGRATRPRDRDHR